MNRRSFLQHGTNRAARRDGMASPAWLSADRTARNTRPNGVAADVPVVNAGDLSPYTPRPEKPWDARRAAHLLRRIGFGPTWEEITAAMSLTPEAIITAALADSTAAPAPSAWASAATFIHPPYSNTRRSEYARYIRELMDWWARRMVELPTTAALREKMTLFWHNHFVSEYTKVETPHLMYRQNQLLRQNAFGDFRDLTKKVTIDAAMLVYLDGSGSKAGNPNENYARELLELFTIGTGFYSDNTPHYTEADIIELAKTLTGWRVPVSGSDSNTIDAQPVYNTGSFDGSQKTIFGTKANFGIEGHGDRNVIDLIFEQNDRDLGRKRAAVFICTKLYEYFVYDTADMQIVAGMAATLEASNWQIGPVLRQLLLSEHFFDDNVIGAKIKSPAEFVAGAIRQLKLGFPNTADENQNVATPGMHAPITAMAYLSQTLLNPPNVKGWPGGRNWISSATVPPRIRYAELWIDPIGGQTLAAYGFKPVDFVKALPDAKTDVDKMLDHLLELMLPLAITNEARVPLMDELLGGGQPYEWDPDAANAAPRIRACMVSIARLGEYQLM